MAIILKTKRLILRHQIMDDLDDLWALYCDPEITKHIPDAPRSREEADYIQHINETCYRLVRGDTLMRKVLSDSALGITILRSLPEVDRERIGMLGHSYGGNTVLFHAALDERFRFSCSSGAACSYGHKIANNIGIEAAEIIPGFVARFDIQDLVACFTPTQEPDSVGNGRHILTGRRCGYLQSIGNLQSGRTCITG